MNEETLKSLTREKAIDLLDNQIDYTFQLNNRWNELKKWLEEEIQYNENWYNPECKEYIGQKNYPDDTIDGFRYTLDKMQELERGEE